jgi:hypothetical protein
LAAHIDHVDAPKAGSGWTGEAGAEWLADRVARKTLPPCRALVLAADMGEEILALCRNGFTTLVVDSSKEALAALKNAARRHGADPTLVQADIFGCPPSLFGPVELIWDRTLFHRLPSMQHAAWAHKTARILPPGGRLLGLFRIGRSPEGPPYTVTLEALTRLLTRHFIIEDLSAAGTGTPGAARTYRGSFRRK